MTDKTNQQPPKKYKALGRLTIEVAFDDNGELSIIDQAHNAIMFALDNCGVVLYSDVIAVSEQ